MFTRTLNRLLLAICMCCLAATANAATLPEAISYFQSKQYDKSLPIFLASSEQGDTKSQSYLARIYVNGLGVEKNNTTALYWASRAAAKNDPISLGTGGISVSTCTEKGSDKRRLECPICKNKTLVASQTKIICGICNVKMTRNERDKHHDQSRTNP